MNTTFLEIFHKGTKNSAFVWATIALASLASLSSCNKDDDGLSSPALTVQNEVALAPIAGGPALNLTNATGTVELSATGGVYTVKNYFVSQGIYDSVGNHIPNGTYFFDFSSNDNKKGVDKNTPPVGNGWDISFSGTGNAYINKRLTGSNNVRYVDLAFGSVTYPEIFFDTLQSKSIATFPFGHNRTVTSYDYSVGTGTTGWFNYYFTNHEVLPTNGRTILIADPNTGHIYALHMISVYKNGAPYEPGDNTSLPPSDYSWLKFEYKDLGIADL